MKNILIISFLLLVGSYGFGQEIDSAQTDSTSTKFIEHYIEQAWNRNDSFSLYIFNKAISLNPNIPIVYWRRGRIYHLQNKLDLAMKDYNTTIRLDSTFDCGYAFWDRALVKEDLGDNEGALKDFDTAIDICPKQSNFLCYRGILKYFMNDLEGAEKDLTAAIELYDNYYLARRWRAPVRTQLNNYVGAIDDYNKAPYRKDSESKPNWAQDYYLRGIAKNETGDKQGGCLDWKIAIKLGNKESIELIKIHCEE